MPSMKWYKRNPHKALEGMMLLSLEERGAYNTILDLIYANGGQIIDDDRFLSGWMRCDVRVWKRIKNTLIEREKLYQADGFLRNRVSDLEIDDALRRLACSSDAGRASARKRKSEIKENNDLAPTSVERTLQPLTYTVRKEVEGKPSTLKKSEVFSFEFLEFWGSFPKQREGSKAGASKAYCRATARASPDEILAGCKAYAQSAEVKRGFAKGAAAWLNDDRWKTKYQQIGAQHETLGGSIAKSQRFKEALVADLESETFDFGRVPRIEEGSG